MRDFLFFGEVIAVTQEERIAQNPQWRKDYDFLYKRLFEFEQENIPLIRQIIESYPGKLPENRDLRRRGYIALSRHLRRFPDPEHMKWHIAQVTEETDKWILASIMDELWYWPGLPEGTNIQPLIACTKSDKWLIFQSALDALSLCDCDEARQAVRTFLTREPIRKNEPTYSSVMLALQKIGTPDDLPVLEELHTRATKNIRVCIDLAIDAIKQRYQIVSK